MFCGSCILIWTTIAFGAFWTVLKGYCRLTLGRTTSKRNLTGKTAIVTGANAGLGLETVKELAMRNARVIMACRSLERGQAARDLVLAETGAHRSLVVLKQVDVSSLASVRAFAAQILTEEPRLDILINNAGLQVRSKVLTEDRLESSMAANHFGPFLLTNLLLELMARTPAPGEEARIVNVTSVGHKLPKELDLDNLNLEKRPADAPVGFDHREVYAVYGRTKLANVLFTRELSRKLKEAGIRNVSVNAVHPGNVDTGMNRDSFQGWYMAPVRWMVASAGKTGEEGAQAVVHVAVASELEAVSGGYFVDCNPAEVSKLAQDENLGRKLWDVSAKMVKLEPGESIVSKKIN